ncbi:unnamed protein product, partial [Amoebophrya sp. A120]|eukprot:GSA120T00003575001.1
MTLHRKHSALPSPVARSLVVAASLFFRTGYDGAVLGRSISSTPRQAPGAEQNSATTRGRQREHLIATTRPSAVEFQVLPSTDAAAATSTSDTETSARSAEESRRTADQAGGANRNIQSDRREGAPQAPSEPTNAGISQGEIFPHSRLPPALALASSATTTQPAAHGRGRASFPLPRAGRFFTRSASPPSVAAKGPAALDVVVHPNSSRSTGEKARAKTVPVRGKKEFKRGNNHARRKPSGDIKAADPTTRGSTASGTTTTDVGPQSSPIRRARGLASVEHGLVSQPGALRHTAPAESTETLKQHGASSSRGGPGQVDQDPQRQRISGDDEEEGSASHFVAQTEQDENEGPPLAPRRPAFSRQNSPQGAATSMVEVSPDVSDVPRTQLQQAPPAASSPPTTATATATTSTLLSAEAVRLLSPYLSTPEFSRLTAAGKSVNPDVVKTKVQQWRRFLDFDDPEGGALFRQLERNLFKVAHLVELYFPHQNPDLLSNMDRGAVLAQVFEHLAPEYHYSKTAKRSSTSTTLGEQNFKAPEERRDDVRPGTARSKTKSPTGAGTTGSRPGTLSSASAHHGTSGESEPQDLAFQTHEGMNAAHVQPAGNAISTASSSAHPNNRPGPPLTVDTSTQTSMDVDADGNQGINQASIFVPGAGQALSAPAYFPPSRHSDSEDLSPYPQISSPPHHQTSRGHDPPAVPLDTGGEATRTETFVLPEQVPGVTARVVQLQQQNRWRRRYVPIGTGASIRIRRQAKSRAPRTLPGYGNNIVNKTDTGKWAEEVEQLCLHASASGSLQKLEGAAGRAAEQEKGCAIGSQVFDANDVDWKYLVRAAPPDDRSQSSTQDRLLKMGSDAQKRQAEIKSKARDEVKQAKDRFPDSSTKATTSRDEHQDLEPRVKLLPNIIPAKSLGVIKEYVREHWYERTMDQRTRVLSWKPRILAADQETAVIPLEPFEQIVLTKTAQSPGRRIYLTSRDEYAAGGDFYETRNPGGSQSSGRRQSGPREGNADLHAASSTYVDYGHHLRDKDFFDRDDFEVEEPPISYDNGDFAIGTTSSDDEDIEENQGLYPSPSCSQSHHDRASSGRKSRMHYTTMRPRRTRNRTDEGAESSGAAVGPSTLPEVDRKTSETRAKKDRLRKAKASRLRLYHQILGRKLEKQYRDVIRKMYHLSDIDTPNVHPPEQRHFVHFELAAMKSSGSFELRTVRTYPATPRSEDATVDVEDLHTATDADDLLDYFNFQEVVQHEFDFLEDQGIAHQAAGGTGGGGRGQQRGVQEILEPFLAMRIGLAPQAAAAEDGNYNPRPALPMPMERREQVDSMQRTSSGTSRPLTAITESALTDHYTRELWTDKTTAASGKDAFQLWLGHGFVSLAERDLWVGLTPGSVKEGVFVWLTELLPPLVDRIAKKLFGRAVFSDDNPFYHTKTGFLKAESGFSYVEKMRAHAADR